MVTLEKNLEKLVPHSLTFQQKDFTELPEHHCKVGTTFLEGYWSKCITGKGVYIELKTNFIENSHFLNFAVTPFEPTCKSI